MTGREQGPEEGGAEREEVKCWQRSKWVRGEWVGQGERRKGGVHLKGVEGGDRRLRREMRAEEQEVLWEEVEGTGNYSP